MCVCLCNWSLSLYFLSVFLYLIMASALYLLGVCAPVCMCMSLCAHVFYLNSQSRTHNHRCGSTAGHSKKKYRFLYPKYKFLCHMIQSAEREGGIFYTKYIIGMCEYIHQKYIIRPFWLWFEWKLASLTHSHRSLGKACLCCHAGGMCIEREVCMCA